MKNKLFTTALLLSIPFYAQAAENTPFKTGDTMIRLRAIDVIPQESSKPSVGGSVYVDNSWAPELDATYFFTPNISVELIAATTKHDLKHSSGLDAGSAYVLPPTLTAQYHITEWKSVMPYVGAGINYTHFYDGKGGDLGTVKYKDSVGAALQIGADVPIADNWYFNVDAKKIFIDTTAKFSSGVRADVNIDPLVIGTGIGYKF